MPHFPKPFFRKARGRWYVQLNGKQINLGPDQDKAFGRYHDLMTSPDPFSSAMPEAARPVAALCDQFLGWVKTRRAQPSYEGYLYRLQRFVDRYPNLTVDQLRPFHVQQWADSYEFSATSRRNYMRSLKTCLRWSCTQGYIDKNPLEFMPLPNANRKEIYVSQEEFKRILTHITDPCLLDLFITTYEVGCRPQESLRVERRHVESQHQRWVFPASQSKGKSVPRIVYLTENALAITQRLMVQNPTGPLVRNSHGNPWTPDSVNSAVDRIRLAMARTEMKRRGETIAEKEIDEVAKTLNPFGTLKGKRVTRPKWKLRCQARRKIMTWRAKELVPRYSLYALRHSWATNALKHGIDSLTVAILMGHQDPSMLAKVYQHLSHNPAHLLQQARKAVG